jgi:hypothetical protein
MQVAYILLISGRVFYCLAEHHSCIYDKVAMIGVTVERERQALYVWRNNGTRSRNHCCRGKAIRITYSECGSVAVVIQHAKRMRRLILSSAACRHAIFCHIVGGWGLLNTKRVFWFSLQLLLDMFLILRWIKRDIITNSTRYYHKFNEI